MTRQWDEWLEALPVRPITKNLVNNLILDRPLSPAQITDFGVDSADHYRALKTIVFCGDELEVEESDGPGTLEMVGKRIVELDAALGNGAKLDGLLKRYAPAYADRVHFHTSWDVLFERGDEKAEEKEAIL